MKPRATASQAVFGYYSSQRCGAGTRGAGLPANATGGRSSQSSQPEECRPSHSTRGQRPARGGGESDGTSSEKQRSGTRQAAPGQSEEEFAEEARSWPPRLMSPLSRMGRPTGKLCWEASVGHVRQLLSATGRRRARPRSQTVRLGSESSSRSSPAKPLSGCSCPTLQDIRCGSQWLAGRPLAVF